MNAKWGAVVGSKDRVQKFPAHLCWHTLVECGGGEESGIGRQVRVLEKAPAPRELTQEARRGVTVEDERSMVPCKPLLKYTIHGKR